MEILQSFQTSTIICDFIKSEDNEKCFQKRRLHSQSVRDQFKLDFTELLDQEWEGGDQSETPFFSTKNHISKLKSSYQIQHNAASFAFESQKNKLINKKRKKPNIQKLALKEILTIFDSPIPLEDIDLFLESLCFQNCLRFFVILNLVGLFLTDYSYRLIKDIENKEMSIENKISLHFQLFANCAFTLQIIFRLLSRRIFFRNPWNIINLLGTLACWTSIFMDFVQNDENPWFQLLIVIKIIRGIRVIEVFEFIRNPFEVFITTIPDLGKIFFPLLIFILFYSILGLILFEGANQYKCRSTSEPVQGKWSQISHNLCGAAQFECEKGFCGNPQKYGMKMNQTQIKEYENEYGLVNYNNIGNAILTTYHYVFLSNWTTIKYKFSKFISPYLTSLYFFTLAIFLFFILANLNMITICKAYIEKQKVRQKNTKIKDNDKKVNYEVSTQSLSDNKIIALEVLKKIQVLLIITQTVILVLDYEGIPIHILQKQALAQFSLTWIAFIILLIRTIILNKELFTDNFIIFDWIIIGINVAEIIQNLTIGKSIEEEPQALNKILRCIKILRIIKILYFSQNWFYYEKTILKIFIETVKTIKYFFLLLFCVVIVVSFIGENLFAYKIRFIQGTHILDIQKGQPYISNFQSTYKSIVSIIMLLENQRWTETMYNYYQAVGWHALVFFNLVVFIIHLMLTRLFIAIFLCYFRRNLQKRNNIESQKDLLSKSMSSKEIKDQNSNEQVQDLSENKISEEQYRTKTQIKIFWIFNRNGCLFQLLRAFFISKIFNYIIITGIIVHCMTIVSRTNHDDEEKIKTIQFIEIFPFSIYIIQVLIGILGFGFYFQDHSYIKRSRMNIVNVIVIILIVVSKAEFMDKMISKIIGRFVIIKIFTLFDRTSKETSISLNAMSAIAERFLRVLFVYVFLLLIPAILPLKLQRNAFYYCENSYPFNDSIPTSRQQCMLSGGDWLKEPQSFENIFLSISLMYQIVTSQSWTHFIEKSSTDQPWDLYYVIVFFIYNTCLLNIFVGLTVETYLTLKDEAYKLNLLRPNQRSWILIKNSINNLVPLPSMKKPENTWIFRKISYWILSKSIYVNFIDILAYVNAFIYMLKFYRAPSDYLSDLNQINHIFIYIFIVDTILKLHLYSDYFYLDNSKIQLMGFLFYIIYGIMFIFFTISQSTVRIMSFFGAMLLILRCKKLIFRFTWSKTLVNSVLDVLPKCFKIGGILAIFLFFYASIGMELFKNVKYNPKADGYITGFSNFFTSTMTLLKVVSNESWFEQVSAFSRSSTPSDICFSISTQEEAQKYLHMGCGTNLAFVFFLSFHVLMALLILNVLIATMTSAYDENYQKQYKSVNIFQLQDCLQLWQKYDPQGKGVIPYKKFWRLSSEIAILFGISKKKLIKRKQKFLEQLDIQICQSISSDQTSVLCYKFHDVLTKFSKIKLQVSGSESLDENGEWMDFQIHPLIQRQIEDYITKIPIEIYENYRPYKNYKSGEMKYFFGLLRKLRAWKLISKSRNSSTMTSKLSYIIRSALQKKHKDEIKINQIKKSIVGLLENRKKI